MSIKRNPQEEQRLGLTWEDLGAGAPTIIALARLASQAIVDGVDATELSAEARALLFAAQPRGVIAVKGANEAFDSVDRFLSVHVELDADSVLAFKSKNQPEVTIRFLDALRELCAGGLVMHHLYREFSLSRPGYEIARTIPRDEVAELLEMAAELGRTSGSAFRRDAIIALLQQGGVRFGSLYDGLPSPSRLDTSTDLEIDLEVRRTLALRCDEAPALAASEVEP